MRNDRPNLPVHVQTEEEREILQEAREWLGIVKVYESDIRSESARCLRFRSLEQWDETVLQQRGAQRPSLVFDHTGQFVDQVVNDWRRNRMGISVSPGDENADDETAQVIASKVREIEHASKARIAYDKAMDQMTGQNRAYLRLKLRRRPGSFARDIRIQHIPNPDCVYFDPFAVEVDYSDAMRCLVTDRYGRKQYEQEWGKRAQPIDFTAYSTDGSYGDWITEDAITVAEWWVVKEKTRKIQLLTQPIAVIRKGQALRTDTVYADEYEELPPGVEIAIGPDGEPMEDDEPSREVWCYIVNGVQILEKYKWPGTRIPIIPMYGKELLVNGKKRLYSLISRVLDAQQALNYSISSSIQAVALAPTAPYKGWVGQNKTNEKQIAESNRVPYGFLGFDIIYDSNGNPILDKPERDQAEPPIQATSYLTQQIVNFMKAGVGMYGASLGDREGKTRSGVAERALQEEGDNATFDFLDNGGRAVEMVGDHVVELIPIIYSRPELMQIRDEQDRVMSIAVNQDIRKMAKPPKNQRQSFFLAKGRYNVSVAAAPSHDTLRKEAEEKLLAMMDIATDPADKRKIMLTMMRLSGNFTLQSVANELDPQSDQEDPKQLMAKLQDAMKVIELQTQTINDLESEKAAKKQDNDSKERIAAMNARIEWIKIKAELAKVNAQLDSKEDTEALKIAATRETANLEGEIAQLEAQINALTNAGEEDESPDEEKRETPAQQQLEALTGGETQHR